MPTENRPSTIDPRDLFIRLNPLGLDEKDLAKDSTGFEDPRTHSDYLLFLAGYRETHPEPLQHTEQHQGEPVAWRIPVSGSWFYDTKREACEREYADYRSAFTAEELAEEDTHAPEPLYTHADPGEVERLRAELEEWKQRCQYNADTARDVAKERDTLRAEADRLRQEVASIDKKLRGNVSDPDPLKPIMPGALSVTTTYGLVAGIVRERDQLKKALERQPS